MIQRADRARLLRACGRARLCASENVGGRIGAGGGREHSLTHNTYTVGAAGITATEFGGNIPISWRRRAAYSARGIPSIAGPPSAVTCAEEGVGVGAGGCGAEAMRMPRSATAAPAVAAAALYDECHAGDTIAAPAPPQFRSKPLNNIALSLLQNPWASKRGL